MLLNNTLLSFSVHWYFLGFVWKHESNLILILKDQLFVCACVWQVWSGPVCRGGQHSAGSERSAREETRAPCRPHGNQTHWSVLAHSHRPLPHRPRLASLHESQPATGEKKNTHTALNIKCPGCLLSPVFPFNAFRMTRKKPLGKYNPILEILLLRSADDP